MDPKDKDTKISKPIFDSSQSASSALINFLDLPVHIRNKNYQRVLIVLLHPLYLFQDPGSPVGAFAPDKPQQWLALLHTNRQISIEASAVLYRVNHFELVDITKRQIGVLRSFLDCVGSVNAASLSPSMHQISNRGDYKNFGFFTKTDQFLREAFSQIDAQLKAIHSLQRIIIRVEAQSGVLTSSAKDMMQRLGWLVLSDNEH
jgi:hypothetical protein